MEKLKTRITEDFDIVVVVELRFDPFVFNSFGKELEELLEKYNVKVTDLQHGLIFE